MGRQANELNGSVGGATSEAVLQLFSSPWRTAGTDTPGFIFWKRPAKG
jgi:hypothetical protein